MSKINYYLQTASSLHRLATTRLFQTQALLADRLDHTILSPDGSFLAETEAHTKKLSLPLDKFTVGSQQASGSGDGDDGAGRKEGSLRRLGEVIGRGILEAEEKVAELGGEAVGMMKEIER
ncbi:hypothetical protein MMYC01_202266, partial [Madurella mycetomatis]